jgi:hypothetical protein
MISATNTIENTRQSGEFLESSLSECDNISYKQWLVGNLAKNYYLSDGGSAHYKNKFNFANLSMYSADVDVEVEWHFLLLAMERELAMGLSDPSSPEDNPRYENKKNKRARPTKEDK